MKALSTIVWGGFISLAVIASPPTSAANRSEGTRELPCHMLDVSSTASEAPWSKKALTDGSNALGTGWSSAEHDQPEAEEWCSMLLDAWYVLTGVTLWSPGDTGRGLPVDFNIQFSTDLGRTWYDIPSARIKGYNPKGSPRRLVLEFPEVVARGIRIQATRLSSVSEGKYAFQLAEVQASGLPDPGPFRSSIGGDFDADLNNYWRFFGLGLHRNDMNDPFFWGLKWWGTADTSCCDWTEMKLYWHADAATRASLRHWLHTLPMDADGYVWATDNGRKHLGQHQLFHTCADFINKTWECYRWEGDRDMLTSVPDFGVGIVDTDGVDHDFCSPDDYVHMAAGEGLVLAQTFEAEDEFQAVRVKLQVHDTSVYELRCLHHTDNRLIVSRTFTGTEDHERSWTTLELPEPQEQGEYRIELLNRAPQAEGKPGVFWTNPVGWYCSEDDVYAGGTSGLNGLMDMSLIEKARLAMKHMLDVAGMRGETDGIVVITKSDYTGVPVKPTERGGPSMPTTYYDLVRSGYKEAFVNNRYLKALESMIGLEAAVGDNPQAPRLEQELIHARTAYHRTFWNSTTGRYAGWVDAQGKMWDFGEVVVNLEAILRGAATPESAKSILDWVSGRRTVETDTSKGEDIYFWHFAPRKNTRGYETIGEVNHWWGGWFYDMRSNGTGRGNFGNQEENGGTNPFISYYDVMTRLVAAGPDDAWKRFCTDKNSLMHDFHRDMFYRPTPIDPDHSGEHYQAYVMSLPECGLPVVAMLYGFMGIDPAGHTLHIHPQLPRGVDSLSVSEVGFHGREYSIEIRRPDQIVIIPGPGDSHELSVGVENLAPGTSYVARAIYAQGPETIVAKLQADLTGRATFTWPIDPSAKLVIERLK